MGLSTRLLALLLLLLLFGIPFWAMLFGPTVVIVDGGGPAPVAVSFHSSVFDQPLWRLTGHVWFGWPEGDAVVRVTCRDARGALHREGFVYVTGGPGASETIHVNPWWCRQ